MTQFLIEHFVKDYEDVEKISVRTAYGVLASIVGIFCNVFLFAVKFTIGVIAHSVSVMADAFNNLSDAGSSIISFIGVKMAEKPADRDHPFGHGRIEYIAALVVSFLILEVGFTFLKDSIGKIRTPEMLNFQIASVIILILSIGVKLWLGLFNKRLGEKINSKVMMAVFADSMGDVITTGATILSLIVFRITGWNIDGVVGIGVALVVMWAGVGIAKDTLEPLIGMSELYKVFGIEKKAPGIVGYIFAFGYYALIYMEEYLPGEKHTWFMLLFMAYLICQMAVLVFSYPKYNTQQIMAAFFGVFYVAVMLSYIYLTRMLPGGVFTVWLVFICSWGCDTCAYCVGMLIGKHKMAPVLSPKKSVEGGIGGIAGAALIGVLYALAVNHWGNAGASIVSYAVIGAVGGAISQIGDLAASAIKRYHNIKDYGKQHLILKDVF